MGVQVLTGTGTVRTVYTVWVLSTANNTIQYVHTVRVQYEYIVQYVLAVRVRTGTRTVQVPGSSHCHCHSQIYSL